MTELQKNIKEISQKLGITFSCYPENSKPTDMPVCDKTFEDVTDDGSYTFFRFNFKGVGYIGVITGARTEYFKSLTYQTVAYLYFKRRLSAIMAINSELVGLPRLF